MLVFLKKMSTLIIISTLITPFGITHSTESRTHIKHTSDCLPYSSLELYPPLTPIKSFPGIYKVKLINDSIIIFGYNFNERMVLNKNTGEDVIDSKELDMIPTIDFPQQERTKIIDGKKYFFTELIYPIDDELFIVSALSNQGYEICLFNGINLKWKIKSKDYEVKIISRKRAFIGRDDIKLVDLENGFTLFECSNDSKTSINHNDTTAIIDNNLVISLESGNILWKINKTSPQSRIFYSKDIIIEMIYSFDCLPDGVILKYYNQFTGSLIKEKCVKGVNFFSVKGIAGTCIYGLYNNTFFCYDFEREEKTFTVHERNNIDMLNDKERIYITDEFGIFAFDVIKNDIVWRKELPKIIKIHDFKDSTYLSIVSRDKDFGLIEILQRVGDANFTEISRAPIKKLYRFGNRDYLTTLFPTSIGVLWVPLEQKDVIKPSLIGKNSEEIIKTYNIPDWGNNNFIPLFNLNNKHLLISCDFKTLNIVDLFSGKVKNIILTSSEISGIINSPLLMNDQYAFITLGGSFIVDIEKAKVVGTLDYKHLSSSYFKRSFIRNNWLVINDIGEKMTKIVNLVNFDTIVIKDLFLGATDDGIIFGKRNEKLAYIKYFTDMDNEKELKIKYDESSPDMSFANTFIFKKYLINSTMQDISNGEHIQHLENLDSSYSQLENNLAISNNYSVNIYGPCPSFSIKRIGQAKFEIMMTRTDDKAINLIGRASLELCNLKGHCRPIYTDITNKVPINFNLTKNNLKTILEFTLPDKSDSFFLDNPNNNYCDKLLLKIFSNGLLDTKNSELPAEREIDFHYEGFPISVGEQKNLVSIEWEK